MLRPQSTPLDYAEQKNFTRDASKSSVKSRPPAGKRISYDLNPEDNNIYQLSQNKLSQPQSTKNPGAKSPIDAKRLSVGNNNKNNEGQQRPSSTPIPGKVAAGKPAQQ